MKTLLVLLALAASASGAQAQNCTKNLRGETICSNGQTAAAYNPHTGNAAVAQKNPNGTTTTQTRYGGTATTRNGSGTAHNANSAVAYNSRTGNGAAAHTNSNGVTTTKTTNGGEAKTKNGMGVASGPGGTNCAKGKNHQGCTTR